MKLTETIVSALFISSFLFVKHQLDKQQDTITLMTEKIVALEKRIKHLPEAPEWAPE